MKCKTCPFSLICYGQRMTSGAIWLIVKYTIINICPKCGKLIVVPAKPFHETHYYFHCEKRKMTNDIIKFCENFHFHAWTTMPNAGPLLMGNKWLYVEVCYICARRQQVHPGITYVDLDHKMQAI